jgi:hypothetical protein
MYYDHRAPLLAVEPLRDSLTHSYAQSSPSTRTARTPRRQIMNLTTTARRGSAVVASLAAAGLLTLASPSSVHASGARDSDGDGMPNRWELSHHLNPHHANAKGDPDHDGLKNLGEFRHGTRPHNSDSDDDGVEDGDEVHDGCAATDPTDSDTDDDGTEDGQEDTDGDGLDDADDDTEDNCQGDEDVPGNDDSGDAVAHYVVR